MKISSTPLRRSFRVLWCEKLWTPVAPNLKKSWPLWWHDEFFQSPSKILSKISNFASEWIISFSAFSKCAAIREVSWREYQESLKFAQKFLKANLKGKYDTLKTKIEFFFWNFVWNMKPTFDLQQVSGRVYKTQKFP